MTAACRISSKGGGIFLKYNNLRATLNLVRLNHFVSQTYHHLKTMKKLKTNYSSSLTINTFRFTTSLVGLINRLLYEAFEV